MAWGVRRLALILGVLASVLIAQPVSAWVETARTGTTGAHSLRDTQANPGAICTTEYVSSWDTYKLKRMWVQPPRVKAVAGKDNQKVGWQFTIQRREFNAFTEGPTPWQNRLTSERWFAFTDDATNAAFEQMSAKINVPVEPGSDSAFQYRAIVKVFWYRPNGTVQGTSTMRVQWYAIYQEIDTVKEKGGCFDYT